MFNDFIDNTGGPELAVALRILAGHAFLAEIGSIFRAEIGSCFIPMFDAARFYHIVRTF
jgi:hypothetical protein